jgi:hypothetical protein
MTSESYLEKMKTALEALDKLFIYSAQEMGENPFCEKRRNHVKTIREALKNAGKVDGLVKALEIYAPANISGRIAREALAEFRKKNR